MPRFVILTHDHPFMHWDFLLEDEAALRSWRLLADPSSLMLCVPISAEAIPDHRKLYLDYQGPVSGDRGVVSQWDAGTFESVAETDSCCELELSGERIVGRFRMVQEKGRWLLQRIERS